MKQECEEKPPAGTFALTITKALQDQYRVVYLMVQRYLKGKSNYISTIDSNIDVELESFNYA